MAVSDSTQKFHKLQTQVVAHVARLQNCFGLERADTLTRRGFKMGNFTKSIDLLGHSK